MDMMPQKRLIYKNPKPRHSVLRILTSIWTMTSFQHLTLNTLFFFFKKLRLSVLLTSNKLRILKQRDDPEINGLDHRGLDPHSLWKLRKDALMTFATNQMAKTKTYSDLELARTAIAELFEHQTFGPAIKEYWTLKKQAEAKQKELDDESRKKLLVGSNQ